jgi:hypothetical protein
VSGRPVSAIRVIVPPSSATREESQLRYVGISTTGVVKVQPSTYGAAGDVTLVRPGTAPIHQGSAVG